MISEWMKMGLLILSWFGYWEYFRSKHGIHVYFVPVFTLSVQFCVLFAAGLLNCLGVTALLLYGVGFLLLLQEFSREKFRIFVPYLNIGYLYAAVAFFAVGLAVRDQLFTQIDNFTHWATVVRSMLSTDRFPTFKETAVQFTSYPLGSSALIYFACKMTETTEHMMMWAQAYMILCTILPVFACCKKNRGVYLGFVSVITGFLFNYNIPVTELLVDTLMPLAGMATVWFLCFHCLGQNDTTEHSPYYAVPMLIWTMNVKHAALIFIAFGMVLLYLRIGRCAQGSKQWLLTAGEVGLAYVLWNRHCDYVFDGASFSRHSLSVDWFRTILGDKTTEEVVDTLKVVLTSAVTRSECLWLAAWFLVLGILVWVVLREEKKRYLQLLLSSLALYGVYTIGIAGMYAFSMEANETLLAFTRYMRIVDVAIYYMLMLFSGVVLAKIAGRQYAVAAGVILVLLTAAGWRWQTGKYMKEKLARCPVEWRQELEAPITDYGIQREKKILLCVNENHHGWPRRIWRYRLETGAVDQIIVEDREQLQIAESYDYIVILDEGNPVIASWVQDNYPDAVGSVVIQRFA